jgi:hypothetical protein
MEGCRSLEMEENQKQTTVWLAGRFVEVRYTATYTCTAVYRVVNVKFCLGSLGICLSKWQTVTDN